MDALRDLIHEIPDFPTAGIIFRDITPLLLEPAVLGSVIRRIADRFAGDGIDRVVAIESRGFIFGAPLALALGCGFAPVRKLGKLPRATMSREYALEYGSNHLEIHVDAVEPGHRVLIVDDVLATGGTAHATAHLVEELGGEITGLAFLLEIAGLGGRTQLHGREILSLLTV
jgi:adenine phosphoribosyltransferase